MSPAKIAFIIIAPVIGLTVIALLILFLYSLYSEGKDFQKYVYRKIKRVVEDNDFYLINNFTFFPDETRSINVDHIIFGNKYIYACFDKTFNGNIMGKDTDPSLILVSKDNTKEYIENLFSLMNKDLKQLAESTGIHTDLLIGITITNNSCQTKIDSSSNQFFIINRNNANKLITTIEKRDVEAINEKQLDKAVKIIASQNKKDKKKMA